MTDPLTPDELREVAARAEAATPGPWQVEWWVWRDGQQRVCHRGDGLLMRCARGIHTAWEHGQLRGPAPVVTTVHGIDPTDDLLAYHSAVIDEPDAAFIAHARTDIPRLLATIAALQSENERLTREKREFEVRLIQLINALGYESFGSALVAARDVPLVEARANAQDRRIAALEGALEAEHALLEYVLGKAEDLNAALLAALRHLDAYRGSVYPTKEAPHD